MPREAVMEELQQLFGGDTTPVEVDLEHYERFLDLSDAGMDALVAALARSQGKEVVRVFSKSKTIPVERRLYPVVADTLFAVALGIARFDVFGQLNYHRRTGPNPDAWTNFLIEKKIEKADPMVRKAVDLFVAEALDQVKRPRSKV